MSTRLSGESVASSQICCTSSPLSPIIEAIPTGRPSLKRLMSRERSRTTSIESRNVSASAATAALKRPSECPPKSRGRIERPTSVSFSCIALRNATEVVSTAGWVSVVSESASASSSMQISAMSMPARSLASSKTRRAASEWS